MVECEAFLGGKKSVPVTKLSFRPSVYALIVNDGKVLLVTNRRTGKYTLPGGATNLGEKLPNALRREVREETGIEVEIGKFLFWRENFFYYDPLDEAFHTFQFFFKCTPLTFDLVADLLVDDLESTKPRWYDIAEIKAEQMETFGVEILECLLK